MPYIQIVTTRQVPEDEKERIRRRLGQLIYLIPGKSESVLMIGMMDGVSMCFGGDGVEGCAMVQVHLHGQCPMEAKAALTETILAFMAEALQLSPDRMFLTLSEYPNWGFQGALI